MANIDQVKKIIHAADICGHVPLLEGVHGIGKTEAPAQYAKENNMHSELLILSLMDTGDMLGNPRTRNIGGIESTTWAPPSWYTNIVNKAWPCSILLQDLQFADSAFEKYVLTNHSLIGLGTIDRGELNSLYCSYYELPNDCLQLLRQSNVRYLKSKRSVLILDEFNRTAPDIQNASLQLILEHRLHVHALPLVDGKETLIVATVNPADGNYAVQELDPAMQDRITFVPVSPDLPAWMKWAKLNNVNKVVLDFLLDNQSRFHWTPNDNSKGTSPRTWTRLGHYLNLIDQTDKDIFTDYVIGTIGTSVGAQFISFFNTYADELTYDQLDKQIKKEVTKAKRAKTELDVQKIAEQFSELVTSLDALRRTDYADNFIKQYGTKPDAQQAAPMLVYLHALPLETLSAVLATLKNKDRVMYGLLVNLDEEATDKNLFRKITQNLQGI